MPIEETLAKLTSALEANTAAISKLSALAPAGEPETKARGRPKADAKDTPPAVTVEDFTKLGQKLVDAGKGPKIEEIAKKFKLARCREAFGTDKQAEVLAAMQAVLDEKADAASFL